LSIAVYGELGTAQRNLDMTRLLQYVLAK